MTSSLSRSQFKGLTLLAATALVASFLTVTPAGAQTPTCRGVPATIVARDTGHLTQTIGTDGDDVIVGSPGDDYIIARGGNDLICAGGGHDIIEAGVGNDRVFGGPGNDSLTGSAGNDRLFGGPGDDTVVGEGGRDRIRGGPGNDQVIGGALRDKVNGGTGTDSCDKNSTETPVACEQVTVERYKFITVHTTVTGDDLPAGLDGSVINAWSDILQAPVSSVIQRGDGPTRMLVPRRSTQISVYKELGAGQVAAGFTEIFVTPPSQVNVEVTCCLLFD